MNEMGKQLNLQIKYDNELDQGGREQNVKQELR